MVDLDRLERSLRADPSNTSLHVACIRERLRVGHITFENVQAAASLLHPAARVLAGDIEVMALPALFNLEFPDAYDCIWRLFHEYLSQHQATWPELSHFQGVLQDSEQRRPSIVERAQIREPFLKCFRRLSESTLAALVEQRLLDVFQLFVFNPENCQRSFDQLGRFPASDHMLQVTLWLWERSLVTEESPFHEHQRRCLCRRLLGERSH